MGSPGCAHWSCSCVLSSVRGHYAPIYYVTHVQELPSSATDAFPSMQLNLMSPSLAPALAGEIASSLPGSPLAHDLSEQRLQQDFWKLGAKHRDIDDCIRGATSAVAHSQVIEDDHSRDFAAGGLGGFVYGFGGLGYHGRDLRARRDVSEGSLHESV